MMYSSSPPCPALPSLPCPALPCPALPCPAPYSYPPTYQLLVHFLSIPGSAQENLLLVVSVCC